MPFTGMADTTTDQFQQQKLQKQQQLTEIEQQISSLQTQIKDTESQSASLSNEINLYDIQIQQTQLQVQATQTNMDNANLQIAQTKYQIQNKDTQITQEKQVLGDLIANLSQYDDTSAIQLSLSSKNFSDLLDQAEYTESVQSKVYSLLQQIQTLKATLQTDQTQLQQNLDQLTSLDDQLTATQQTLTDQKSSRVELLQQTKGKQSNYAKLLSGSQSEESQLGTEINDLDNEISGKTKLNKLSPIHGILAWPIDGVITQGYGNTGFTKLGYTFHNGLDIAAPAGTPISAAADGVVVATDNSNTEYGNWVAIKHTIQAANGHQLITLYGHMEKFVVTSGQSVKAGDIIGYEGNTGNTTRLLYGPEHGFHLHFSVFDATGFQVTPGKYENLYGHYNIPAGVPYDPNDFL